MRTPTTAAVCLAAAVGCFVLGWRAHGQPDRIEESHHETQQQTALTWDMHNADEQWRMQAEDVRWIIKRTYRPPAAGCTESTLATEELETEKGSKATTVEVTATNAQGKAATVLLTADEHSLKVVAPLKSWLLQVHAGVSYADGSRFFGGAISKQLLGQFGLGVFADTRGAGIVLTGQFQ